MSRDVAGARRARAGGGGRCPGAGAAGGRAVASGATQNRSVSPAAAFGWILRAMCRDIAAPGEGRGEPAAGTPSGRPKSERHGMAEGYAPRDSSESEPRSSRRRDGLEPIRIRIKAALAPE